MIKLPYHYSLNHPELWDRKEVEHVMKLLNLVLQMSFPGHLHLVLVLRPKTHLQTTGTDLGFRFSQDDFALKMPVSTDENPLWYKTNIFCKCIESR